jgi:hypothetical protein
MWDFEVYRYDFDRSPLDSKATDDEVVVYVNIMKT